jgi:hypothetical protein
MPRPKTGISRYVRDCGVEEIPTRVVETPEVNPPRGVTPMRWVLLTSEPVHRFADTRRTIEMYEKRPLVEEYHKCLKTGCSVEARQFRTGDRRRHRRGDDGATAWRSARVSRPRRLARPTGLPRSSQSQVSEVFVLAKLTPNEGDL